MKKLENVLKSAVVNFSVANFNEVLTDSAVATLANSPVVNLAASSINRLDPSKLSNISASVLVDMLRGVSTELSCSQVANLLCSAVANLSASQTVNISRSAMANIAGMLKEQPNASVAVTLTGDHSAINNIVSSLNEWNKRAGLSITGDTPVK